MTSRRLTVGITTRDRPESLRRCIRSLAHIAHLEPQVIVFDDGSRVPVTEQLENIPHLPLRVIRDERGAGYITGRNRIVGEANSPSFCCWTTMRA